MSDSRPADPDAVAADPASLDAGEPAPLSRRQALAVGSGLAAAAAAGSVAAAGPAAAETAGATVTLRSVSLRQAQAVVAAAEREANRLGVPVNIVVVDACGDVKASARQDRNSPASLTLAPLKAQTSLAFRTSTATLAERSASDPVRQQSFLAAGFTLLGGGLPLLQGEEVIGAIGVGGGSPEQDTQIALAGRRALRR